MKKIIKFSNAFNNKKTMIIISLKCCQNLLQFIISIFGDCFVY